MKETKYNLVIASKFKNREDIYPEKQKKLCKEHYNKSDFKDYQINKHQSSMPKKWCEVCSPPENLL